MVKKLLILGAGPTGLGAACRLAEKGHPDYLICERNSYVGGLSASFLDSKGFTWDVGGHVVFSHYPAFDRFFEEMTGGEVFTHDRKSAIRIAQRYVPYPFQSNIRHLPPQMLEECLKGLEEAQRRYPQPDTSNFLAWNLSRFGEGITRLFIQPDNEKRWAYPMDKISAAWVGERVSPVDLERIRRNIKEERDDVGWGPNNRFQFPMRGGTGSVFEAAARKIGDRLRLNREAVEVDVSRRTVRFSDGGVESYDALLSTAPIDLLMKIIRGAPERLVERAASLRHADGFIVGFGFRKPCPSELCWIYSPEAVAPNFRTTYFTNYSPDNGPDEGCFSLMCDISHSDCFPRRKETIVEETLRGLIETGIIGAGDRDALVSTWIIDAPYTYPIPTLDRDAILADLHEYLEPLGICSRGRFGAWLYEIGNMDHSVVMGMEWADATLEGDRENVWRDRK